MAIFWHSILLSFIPLFVAIDAVGVLPVFWSLTADMEDREKKRLITQAGLTALLLAAIFLFAGKLIFQFLGINENDFRIAGGLVLLIISIADLTTSPSGKPTAHHEHVGVVPIGTPLMMGPAALTTILIEVDAYGYLVTFVSILLNLGITWVLFQKSDIILRLMSDAGSRAVAKVMALLMAAIAVMMIRVGLYNIWHGPIN